MIRPKSSDPPGNFFRKVISSFHPLLLVKHANLYGTRACGFRSGRGRRGDPCALRSAERNWSTVRSISAEPRAPSLSETLCNRLARAASNILERRESPGIRLPEILRPMRPGQCWMRCLCFGIQDSRFPDTPGRPTHQQKSVENSGHVTTSHAKVLQCESWMHC